MTKYLNEEQDTAQAQEMSSQCQEERVKQYKIKIDYQDVVNEEDIKNEFGGVFMCVKCKGLPVMPIVQCTSCNCLYCSQCTEEKCCN